MRLYPEKIQQHLNHSTAPVYLIVGDEPLQRREMLDLLRQYAHQQGFEATDKFELNKQFDWSALFNAFCERSLFSQQQLIELHLTTKPDASAAKQLISLSQQLHNDYLLIITCPKLTAAQLRSAWFTAFEQQGVYIPVNAPDKQRFPQWVGRRLSMAGFSPSADLISPLCYHFEGNLLALDQAINKLQIIYPEGAVTQAQLLATLVQDSRYTSFQLIDTLLQGDIPQATTILQQLEAEGVEPVIISWAINRELLLLLKIKEALAMGEAQHAIFKRVGIWQQRQPLFNAAIKRLSFQCLATLLSCAAQLDRQLKTHLSDTPYHALSMLCDGFIGEHAAQLLQQPLTQYDPAF